MLEFRCPACQRLLRVPDETAGRQARCPACAAAVGVPSLEEIRRPSAGETPAAASTSQGDSAYSRGDFDTTLPYAGAAASGRRGWTAWTAGLHWGPADSARQDENPVTPRTAIRPTCISVGEVFSQSWSIFVNNLGGVIGASLVVYLLDSVCSLLIGVLQDGALRGGNWTSDLGVTIITYVAGTAFSVWITAGLFQYLLRIARGQPAHFGQLLEAGSLVVPATIATIIYGLIVSVGLIACIVPGIVLGLMYWMAVPLLIDTRMGVAEAFRLSKRVTDGNKWALAGVWLLSVGVALAGALFFCVGLVVALPFIVLLHTVAYLAMTGQPLAGMAPAAAGENRG